MNLPVQPATPRATTARTASPMGGLIVAVVMLSFAAVLAGPVARWLNLDQGKRPLPLVAALDTLDASRLHPYRVAKRHILDPAVVEALGTEMYVNWTLEDTSLPARHPLRYVTLLVTYDTGGHNLVPHTPDVCYLGAGYAKAQPHSNTEIVVDSLSSEEARLPIRVCTFSKTALFANEKQTVIYTFRTNGRFVATRTDVRLLINDLRNHYAYFSKVEISFPKASREQAIEGAKKLYGRVLPILIENHWPDSVAAEQEARRSDEPDGA